jgi:hypothetical protein
LPSLSFHLSVTKLTKRNDVVFFLEIVAGTVSMGLGGYLAGLSEIEHYDAERKRELYEIATVPEREEEEIFEIFEVRSLPMTSFPSFFPVIQCVYIYI